jgi:hypothetical protein
VVCASPMPSDKVATLNSWSRSSVWFSVSDTEGRANHLQTTCLWKARAAFARVLD